MPSRPDRAPNAGPSPPPPGRRGRPTAARAADIDSRILNAALEMFGESSYEGTAMEAIAERAQVSKGTLYARYPQKEALFRAVIEDRIANWSALNRSQDHLLPLQLEARLRVHADTLRRMVVWPEYVRTVQLVRSAAAAFPDLAAFWQEVATQRFVRFLADDMAGVAPAAARERVDWRFLANLFLHGFTNWYQCEMAAGNIDEDRVRAFVDQLIATVRGVVTAAEAAPGDASSPCG